MSKGCDVIRMVCNGDSSCLKGSEHENRNKAGNIESWQLEINRLSKRFSVPNVCQGCYLATRGGQSSDLERQAPNIASHKAILAVRGNLETCQMEIGEWLIKACAPRYWLSMSFEVTGADLAQDTSDMKMQGTRIKQEWHVSRSERTC